MSLPAPNRDIGVVLVDVVEDSVLDLGVWIGGHGESVMMVRSTIILEFLLRNDSASLTIISIVPADGLKMVLLEVQPVLRTNCSQQRWEEKEPVEQTEDNSQHKDLDSILSSSTLLYVFRFCNNVENKSRKWNSSYLLSMRLTCKPCRRHLEKGEEDM